MTDFWKGLPGTGPVEPCDAEIKIGVLVPRDFKCQLNRGHAGSHAAQIITHWPNRNNSAPVEGWPRTGPQRDDL